MLTLIAINYCGLRLWLMTEADYQLNEEFSSMIYR